MSALADIFAAVRLQLDKTGFEAQATALADRQGKNVGERMSKGLNSKLAEGLKQSVLTGIGLGAGIDAWGRLADAIGSAKDLLVDSVKAAIEEQASTGRMTAALRANVAGWDGSTEAIDRRIQAGMRLAFSDDDIRESFTKLVAATHDVEEAFRIQRVAMDLARFKGISLTEASDALVKVEAGQYRALKQLGIVLRDGATQTEALAAVEKVAAGQAAAYADTVAGKTEQLQHRWEQLQQEIGKRVIPTLELATGGLVDLAQAGDEGVDSFDKLQRGLIRLDAAIAGIVMPGSALARGFQADADAIDRIDATASGAQAAVDRARAAYEEWKAAQLAARAAFQESDKREAVANIRAIAAAEQHAADVAAMFAKTTRDSTITVADRWDDLITKAEALVSALDAAGRAAADALYGPIEDRAHMQDVKGRIAEIYKNAKTEHRKLTAAERAELASLRSDLLQTQVKLAGEGKLTKTELSKLIDQLQTQSQKATGATKAYLDELIQKLVAVQNAATKTAAAVHKIPPKGNNSDPTKLASGGPIRQPSVVGEAGWEFYVPPDAQGRILSHADSMAAAAAALAPAPAAGGGGLTVNVPVQVQGLARARNPLEIAHAARRYARLGVLSLPPALVPKEGVG